MTSPEQEPRPEARDFSAALRTQRSILNAHFLWGIPLDSSECMNPVATEQFETIKAEEVEGGRRIRFSVSEAGDVTIDWGVV